NNFIRRETAAQTLTDRLKTLDTYGVSVPEEVSAAVANVERIDKLRPKQVTNQDVVAAFEDPKATHKSVHDAAVAMTVSDRLREAWNHARGLAALRALGALARNVDDVIEQLRPRVSEHIDLITWWAEQGAPTAEQLLRQNRLEDAQRVVHVTHAVNEWAELRRLRSGIGPRDLQWFGGMWANVDEISGDLQRNDVSTPEGITAVITAGGQPWWPTVGEAVAVNERIDAQQAEEAKKGKMHVAGAVAFG